MENSELATLYERDIRGLIAEIDAFVREENIWRVAGSVKNSSGNIALHIIGGLNYLIGTVLLETGYVRNRDREFLDKGISRKILVEQLAALIPMMSKVLRQLTPPQMHAPYPRFFDKEGATNSYVITQLLLHLSYHLGQVNYLRRILE